jgi:hypothetical protein
LANGKRYDNENLRTNASGLTYKDGYSGEYSYIYVDRSPDVGLTDFGSCPATRGTTRRRRTGKHRRPAHRRRPAFTG